MFPVGLLLAAGTSDHSEEPGIPQLAILNVARTPLAATAAPVLSTLELWTVAVK
ncbi:MAG: hypothetical protein MZW92_40800 [Comamonadaceae bacterium]|nr:hypothetical protein [Comamonadaceae bacterium]